MRDMMESNELPLSPAGERRRVQILDDARRTARRKRRRRQSGPLLVFIAVACAGWWAWPSRHEPIPVAQNTAEIVATDVATRPTAATPVSVKIISDEELLATLEAHGQPAGLARIGDRVELIYHDRGR
jgi:hypothetical protein